MMNLDSSISLNLIFSLIILVTNFFTISSILKRDNEANNSRDLDISKQFVKINMKLDEFCRNISDLTKKADKSSSILEEVQKSVLLMDARLDRQDEILKDHEARIKKLEEDD